MRKYEIMLILDKDCFDKKAITERLEKILKTDGGKIVEREDWGLKKFAYEINHKNEGFYSVYIVETNSENINEFERVCRIDKNVVRNMVINTESEKRYIQSTKLSKTDMTKFREERKEFKKPYNNKFRDNNYRKPNDRPKSEDSASLVNKKSENISESKENKNQESEK